MRAWLLTSLILLASCAPSTGQTPGSSSGSAATPAASTRVLTIGVHSEPSTVAAGFLIGAASTVATSVRLFNAALDYVDDRGVAHPYLAQGLPQLNTESWQVFADGHMETRYELRPDAVWQDGEPLTARDFTFAWQVDSVPDLGLTGVTPLSQVEEVTAPDDRTVLVRWKQLYPTAGVSQVGGYMRGLMPFPQHVLQSAFDQGRWDTFSSLPYWTTSFIGLGPYRLTDWQQGAYIEGSAFAGHVLGQPKIGRIRISFVGDYGAAMARVLSGDLQFAADSAIQWPQGQALKQQWADSNAGAIHAYRSVWQGMFVQLRPDMMTQPALADLRVRKALAYSLDRAKLGDAIWGDPSVIADTIFVPDTPFYPSIDPSVTKYPFDLRRSEALLADAGFTRGADGFYTSESGSRISFDLRSNSGEQYGTERSIMAADWRTAGFAVNEVEMSGEQERDKQLKASFPGLLMMPTGLDEGNLVNAFTSGGIPTAANRWSGNNLGGWSSDAYDQVASAFGNTLDPDVRIQQRAAIAQMLSEQLPAISLVYQSNVVSRDRHLRGVPLSAVSGSTGIFTWNIQDWDFDDA